MVLWTILPPEQVLEGLDQCPVYEEVDLEGAKLVVERLSPLECRIVRLLSTAPADYLRSEFQPGVILTYKPMLTG